MKKVNINELSDKVESLFKNVGFDSEISKNISDNLITVEMYGVSSHGLKMVKPHIERAKKGGYNISGKIKLEKKSHSFTLVNANNTIGFYSAKCCMDIAINSAKKEGMHIVFCNNANTYGAGFYYTKLAIDQGLIGICFSNSPANMPPTGGIEPMLGTNPLSIGIPGKQKGPIIYDIATSVVAKSKIGTALEKKEQIPLGWAIDKEGNPTTDPFEAIQGMVLPMAGYKGYGLAMCIDILSGLISGAAFLNNVNKFYSDNNDSMNVGHTFIAIDPNIIDSYDFYSKIDQYIDAVKNSKKNRDSTILYPGENMNNEYIRNKKDGLFLYKDKFEYIFSIAEESNSYEQ